LLFPAATDRIDFNFARPTIPADVFLKKDIPTPMRH
jgi:hypothetical protein